MAAHLARTVGTTVLFVFLTTMWSVRSASAQGRTTKGAIAGGSIGLLTDGLDGAIKGATLGGGAAAVTGGGEKQKEARKGAKTGAVVGGSVGLLTDGLGGAIKGGAYGGAVGGMVGRKKKKP